MTIKLHRCRVLFAKSSRHPCWRVQSALNEAGIDYEVVKQPIRKSKRTDFAVRSGQRLLPAVEFEDGSFLREESMDLAARIRGGRLSVRFDKPARELVREEP
jgi:Glutathione S-transferase, N-terminal domain